MTRVGPTAGTRNEPPTYLVIGHRDGCAEALRRLRMHLDGHFTLRPEEDSYRERRFYDSFDRRLFRAGLLLSWTDGTWRVIETETGAELARRRGPAGVRLASCRGDSVECALDSVAREGEIGRIVAEHLDNRRLVLVLHEEEGVRRHTLVDGNGKTHGAVDLIDWRASPRIRRTGRRTRPPAPTVGVIFRPLRGYRDTFDLIQEAIDGTGHTLSWSRLLQQRFAAADLAPGYHQTKPDVEGDSREATAVSVSRIGCHLIRIMQEQVPGVLLRIDPEYLHDYRVALRRLRSVVGNLPGVFPVDVETAIRSRLRQLWMRTGAARDLDVLEESRVAYSEEASASLRSGVDDLAGFIRSRRIEAYTVLSAYVCAGTHDADLRTLMRAFEGLAHDHGARGGKPVRHEAGAALRRRIKKVRRLSRRIDVTDESALHALRVQCKKLRYLLEVFGGLFDVSQLGDLTRELKWVQDALGRMNDYAVQQATLGQFLDEMPNPTPRTAAAVGAIITGLEQSSRREQRRIRKKLPRHLRPLNDRRWSELFQGAEEVL